MYVGSFSGHLSCQAAPKHDCTYRFCGVFLLYNEPHLKSIDTYDQSGAETRVFLDC